jgi:ATP-dependent 26S proteasome regulatory subunit
MSPSTEVRPYRDNYEHLADELRWLDVLIRLRIAAAQLQGRTSPETQAARAVYITPGEVEWLLSQGPAETPRDAGIASLRAELDALRAGIDARMARSSESGVSLALTRLCRIFGLGPFERAAIVICLAPELRRKYDRIYAYLQDDITRKRPSVDLVLELLCETEPQRWQARALLADGATLFRAGLVRKMDDPHSPSGSSGLAQFLSLDSRIFGFLLGNNQMDPRLVGPCRFIHPAADAGDLALDPEIGRALWNLVEHHLAAGPEKLVLHLHGPRGVGKRELALYLASRLDSVLLTLDAEHLAALGREADSKLLFAFREGLLQQAVICVENAGALLQDSARPLLDVLRLAISEYASLVILTSETPWPHQQTFPGCHFHSAALPPPDVPARAAAWRRSLDELIPETQVDAARLAEQFRLTPGQIRAAVRSAHTHRLMDPAHRTMTHADLAAACRAQSNHRLRDLAVRIEPRLGWDDLILPEDKLRHLREICEHARQQYRVFGTWGFAKKLRHGRGLSALFAGPSGTGKTMAAEVLAGELGFDLYRIDLSGVVSKYIGETEKNLSRIFAEAETANAILFFDEADALFGKRTEVADAHDRYANIETSYLLQKMEEYEGVVIMATNLSENMDEAFTRRVRFIVEFPFPDENHCRRIWETHFPPDLPRASIIDFAYLARELRLPGGNIRNIVLSAAFLAAEDGGVVGMDHILHAARREYEKMGRLWRDRRQESVSRAN